MALLVGRCGITERDVVLNLMFFCASMLRRWCGTSGSRTRLCMRAVGLSLVTPWTED